MTIGLDTSIVLRLLTGEPPGDERRARAMLERAQQTGEPVVVTDLVLAEAYYALQTHYRFSKSTARHGLLEFVRSGLVHLSPPDAVVALTASAGAGFVDRLIHARHIAERVTSVALDRKMAALPGAVRLR